ncbi:MAG: DUF3427 domain-containing protein [Armatimonadota bacterium]|nr:DUF3427 domain-containing protein [bacterium]
MLKPGLYEQIVDQLIHESMSQMDPSLIRTEILDDGESHNVLSEYLQHVIGSKLRGITGPEKLSRQVDICNRIIKQLSAADRDGIELDPASVMPDARRLLYVLDERALPPVYPERPDTPISQGCILTGTRLDPSFESQIKKEIRTASRIDILCSFIKWSGIRMLEDELREFTAKTGALLRVITTSYLGATELKAIEFLRKLPNTEVKVSYDTRRTRLHAKAYTFHRKTEFGTAYIGSANLSRPALTEGLEWNVKVSQYESLHLWEKVTAAFETYWNDAEFVSYSEEERPRLHEALQSERGGAEENGFAVNFDLRPYPFQQEILDQLEAEREVHYRDRHLVVAATGTGKTMIAAFDYKHWCGGRDGNRPRLLFVAHREEILTQSLHTFRHVLRDQNFGDKLVGQSRPDNLDHVFVSIQSYNAQRLWETLPADYHDYVVVDEFHHAAAASYGRLLKHIRPRVLLGLTATPERTDGIDVLRYFNGHMSAEIRLPDAINRKLLCPFQYFGISDSVDLSGLAWQRGGYRLDELNTIFTGNDLRADLVIQKVSEILLDPRQTRGLGFCVSIAHAEYMAEKFRQAGIPAESLSAESNRQSRNTVQKRLLDREINFIFTVDLYNEGVDIPEVDTVLFLRPTESLTVFLQQLGRGLRHSDGKDCLTVLDFIGQAHRKFRFDVRYRALIDDPSRSVADQVENGFPHLPAGCSIHLERIAKQHILRNIRQSLLGTRSYLVQEIADLVDRWGRVPSFGEFLEFYRLEPEDIYRRGVSWSRLCVEAGIAQDFSEPDEERITKGLRRIEHIGDAGQIRRLLEMLKQATPVDRDDELDEIARRLILMMDFTIWGKNSGLEMITEGIRKLEANPILIGELVQLLEYRLGRIDSVAPGVELPFLCPLTLHAEYTRDEILAGLGHWTLHDQREMREGVLHLPEIRADVFLITLNKTETEYSPTTMYEDYAISNTLFHWQSQSTTSEDSPTGRRYIEHIQRGNTILLFVREHKSINGLSAPYYFLGPSDYLSHSGSRPISFTWKLQHPMPARLLRKTARMVV